MDSDKTKARFAAKWPEDVAQRGFVPVPRCLVTCIGRLGLKPVEALVLNLILEKCWKEGEVSFQSISNMGLSLCRGESTIKSATKGLEEKKFIQKTRNFNRTSYYDLKPAGKILNEHQKHCIWLKPNSARKPTPNRQEIDYPFSQETNSYIEPDNLEPLNKNNINSRTSNNGGYDHRVLEGEIIGLDRLKISDNKSLCLSTGGRHIWRSYEQVRTKQDGTEVIYYYVHCINCFEQYHKKGEPPMTYKELPEPVIYI